MNLEIDAIPIVTLVIGVIVGVVLFFRGLPVVEFLFEWVLKSGSLIIALIVYFAFPVFGYYLFDTLGLIIGGLACAIGLTSIKNQLRTFPAFLLSAKAFSLLILAVMIGSFFLILLGISIDPLDDSIAFLLPVVIAPAFIYVFYRFEPYVKAFLIGYLACLILVYSLHNLYTLTITEEGFVLPGTYYSPLKSIGKAVIVNVFQGEAGAIQSTVLSEISRLSAVLLITGFGTLASLFFQLSYIRRKRPDFYQDKFGLACPESTFGRFFLDLLLIVRFDPEQHQWHKGKIISSTNRARINPRKEAFKVNKRSVQLERELNRLLKHATKNDNNINKIKLLEECEANVYNFHQLLKRVDSSKYKPPPEYTTKINKLFQLLIFIEQYKNTKKYDELAQIASEDARELAHKLSSLAIRETTLANKARKSKLP